MIEAARKFVRIPARNDIPTDSLPPEIAAALRQVKPRPMDRALLAAHLDEWMGYWDSNIRNHGGSK
jgi:hypothetical protein